MILVHFAWASLFLLAIDLLLSAIEWAIRRLHQHILWKLWLRRHLAKVANHETMRARSAKRYQEMKAAFNAPQSRCEQPVVFINSCPPAKHDVQRCQRLQPLRLEQSLMNRQRTNEPKSEAKTMSQVESSLMPVAEPMQPCYNTMAPALFEEPSKLTRRKTKASRHSLKISSNSQLVWRRQTVAVCLPRLWKLWTSRSRVR
jgi:hypothetical protein